MPEINSHTPKEDFTINKQIFQVYKPYAAGHVLTEGEASALNQTFSENIRNNFAANVKSHLEGGTFDQAAMQATLDEYMSKYEFGVRSYQGPRLSGDPVMARALELAREKIKAKIREVGGSLKDYEPKAITERARKAVESNPKFLELAKRQLDEEAAIAEDDLDVSGLETVQPEGAEAEGTGRRKRAAATAEA